LSHVTLTLFLKWILIIIFIRQVLKLILFCCSIQLFSVLFFIFLFFMLFIFLGTFVGWVWLVQMTFLTKEFVIVRRDIILILMNLIFIFLLFFNFLILLFFIFLIFLFFNLLNIFVLDLQLRFINWKAFTNWY